MDRGYFDVNADSSRLIRRRGQASRRVPFPSKACVDGKVEDETCHPRTTHLGRLLSFLHFSSLQSLEGQVKSCKRFSGGNHHFAFASCNMLAHTLTRALIAGFLALPGDAFITRPPTTAPVDTIGDCTSWVVAQPSDDCELLAKRNQVPLPQLLSYVRRLSPFDHQIWLLWSEQALIRCPESRPATELRGQRGFLLLQREEKLECWPW